MKESRPQVSFADRLASLGDGVRLRTLCLLAAEELAVGEVARVLQLPQSTVSRHLKVLAEAGWVSRRQQGTATLYRMVLDDLSADDRAVWVAVREAMGDRGQVESDAARLRAVLAERKIDTETYFGRVAGEWDEVRASLFGSAFTGAGLLGLLPRGWTVADVGCGTGNAMELLAPFVREVIGIDVSEAMIEAGRHRLGHLPNVRFVQGSAVALPLGDGSVDAAVAVLLLHHLEDPGSAVREMARVVRGGGRMLVIDMMEHGRGEYRNLMGHKHLGFGRDWMERAFAGAGVREFDWRPLACGAEAKGPPLFVASGRVERRES